MMFGKVTAPIDTKHIQTGSYRSADWQVIVRQAYVMMCGLEQGLPLLAEAPSRTTSPRLVAALPGEVTGIGERAVRSRRRNWEPLEELADC